MMMGRTLQRVKKTSSWGRRKGRWAMGRTMHLVEALHLPSDDGVLLLVPKKLVTGLGLENHWQRQMQEEGRNQRKRATWRRCGNTAHTSGILALPKVHAPRRGGIQTHNQSRTHIRSRRDD